MDNIGWWTSIEDEIGWQLAVPADGESQVTTTASCARDTVGDFPAGPRDVGRTTKKFDTLSGLP